MNNPYRRYPKNVEESLPLSSLFESIVGALADELDPEKIILFGSSARGETGPDSDLDLMVVVTRLAADRGEVTRAYRALREIPDRPPVDVLVFARSDVEKWKDVVGHVINDALTDGRIVYDGA